MTKRRLLRTLLRKMISEYNILPRARLARKYLKGEGIEIGAQATPLKVPPHAKVKYLDVIPREEILRQFPDLDPEKVVHVDFISDGFKLYGIPDARFNFLIANHVLEHSPNPLGTLIEWIRVLNPGGRLFCSVPRLDRNFDKGRSLTTWEHLYQDYELYRERNEPEIRFRNLEHYKEWLLISEAAILKRPAISGEAMDVRLSEMSTSKEEIHFHTFNKALIESIFRNLGKVVLPELKILALAETRIEIIVVVEKAQI